LEWLGHLRCMASVDNKMTTSVVTRHRSLLTRRDIRSRSPVPQVYAMPRSDLVPSAIPVMLSDSSDSLVDSGIEEEVPAMVAAPGLEYVLPLSRPNVNTPLVQLNNVESSTTPPIFIVHPVTGVLNMLRWIGKAVTSTRCFGIQQTESSPQDCVQLARYYLEACIEAAGDAPLFLAGYSFGGAIAVQMALEAQQLGRKVACLVMLDGSPQYVKLPLQNIRGSNPAEKVCDVMDTELMLAFIQLYCSLDANSVRRLLERADNTLMKMKLSVECTLVAENSSLCVNQWLVASRRALNAESSVTSLPDLAEGIVVKKRLQRAYQFYMNMIMVDRWDLPSQLYEGDIYLIRCSNPPRHCPNIPEHYGLREMCTGDVIVTHLSTTHEGLVLPPHAADIAGLLDHLVTRL